MSNRKQKSKLSQQIVSPTMSFFYFVIDRMPGLIRFAVPLNTCPQRLVRGGGAGHDMVTSLISFATSVSIEIGISLNLFRLLTGGALEC